MVKKFFLILFIFNCFLIFPQVSVELKSSKTSVYVNTPFQISVEVSGRNAKFQEVRDLDDSVKLKHIGNSSNYSFINGVAKSTSIATYMVVISKVGNYKIGPFVYKDGNTLYESNVLEMSVTTSGSASNGENDLNEYENSNYIIMIEVSKKSIYVNEPLLVSVKLYAKEQLQQISYDSLKMPSDAWVENINQTESYRGEVRINNQTYNEYEIERKRVFLPDYGEFTIPPVVFNFNGVSGHSTSWFSYLEPMSIHSRSVKIDVLPLPKTDKNFSGFVGVVTSLKAELSKDKLKLNEPTQLTIRLVADGNLHNISNINYSTSSESLDEYSTKSETSLDGGKRVKKWDILLVPKKSGECELTIDDFTYFDIAKREYITIPKEKLSLEVSNESIASNEELILHSSSNTNQDNNKNVNIETVPDEIGFIKTHIGSKFNKGIYNIYLYIMAAIYIIIILIALIILIRGVIERHLLKNSKDYQRKNAYKKYQEEIKNSIKNIEKSNDTSKPLNDIYKIVETYFNSKFSTHSVDFTYLKIIEKIDIDDKYKSMLKDFFDTISFGRFAGKTLTKIEIITMIDKISSIIKEIERGDGY